MKRFIYLVLVNLFEAFIFSMLLAAIRKTGGNPMNFWELAGNSYWAIFAGVCAVDVLRAISNEL